MILIFTFTSSKSVKLIYWILYENHTKIKFLFCSRNLKLYFITGIFRNKTFKIIFLIDKKININLINKKEFFYSIYLLKYFLWVK